MLNRLAVDQTEEERQLLMDAMKVTGHTQKSTFVRFLLKRMARDIKAELDGYRVCHKRKDEIVLLEPLVIVSSDEQT